MNTKFLASLAAAALTTLTHTAAAAETLGEHPAVLAARAASNPGIDPNTFIVQHPAGHVWLAASPTLEGKVAREPATRAVTTASALVR